MVTELPPLPNEDVSARPSAYHNIDNRPSWMTSKEGDKRGNFQTKNTTPHDNARKVECGFFQLIF